MKGLADRLKALRGAQNQAEFAASIGMSTQSISRYENGKSSPDLETIQVICAKFGINPQWFVFGTGPMRSGEEVEPQRTKEYQERIAALEAEKAHLKARLAQKEATINALTFAVNSASDAEKLPMKSVATHKELPRKKLPKDTQNE